MSTQEQPGSRFNRAGQVPGDGALHQNQFDGRLDGQQPDDLRARIGDLAFGLYEQRGRQDGQALDDWLEAERQVMIDAK